MPEPQGYYLSPQDHQLWLELKAWFLRNEGQDGNAHHLPFADISDSDNMTLPAKITAVNGSFPTYSYTVQKVIAYDASLAGSARWVTDGIDITGVLNRCEFSGTPPYTYGTGNTITASDGTVNSSSCKIIPIGIGSVVDLRVVQNNSNNGFTCSFFATNSAQ